MKKVYKLVYPNFSTGFYESIATTPTTKYSLNETRTQPEMPFFAVKTLERAREMKPNDCVILECAAVPSNHQPKFKVNCYHTSKDNIELFWHQSHSKKKITVPKDRMVKGTILCDSITPFQVVN